ncbi:ankyrin repeat-containing domain protein, partial [Lactarius hengduanensis]
MGQCDAVQLLLCHNADPLIRDNEGNTPLHHSVAIGDFGSARSLLERNVEVNAQNDEGSTPLHQAAQGSSWRDGCPEIVRLLLDHGADGGCAQPQWNDSVRGCPRPKTTGNCTNALPARSGM